MTENLKELKIEDITKFLDSTLEDKNFTDYTDKIGLSEVRNELIKTMETTISNNRTNDKSITTILEDMRINVHCRNYVLLLEYYLLYSMKEKR